MKRATAICIAAAVLLAAGCNSQETRRRDVPPRRVAAKPAPVAAKPVPAPLAPAPEPLIVEIGPPDVDGFATGLNDKGQVAGYFGRYSAFAWDREAGLVDLGKLTGESCVAIDVNNSGVVIGHLMLDSRHSAFVWDRVRGYRNLGTCGAPHSESCDVNDNGVVVGMLLHAGNRSFIMEPPAEARLLTEIGDRFATAINDCGVIAGYNNYLSAWIRRPGGDVIDIGLSEGSQVVPYSINNREQVVGIGYSGNAGYEPHRAWIWDATGGMRTMGTLGGAQAEAYAINDVGVAVGWAHTADGAQHASLYRAGKMKDLNEFLPPGSGWELTCARDINQRGQICGWGRFNGHTRAFLLTVPPTALAAAEPPKAAPPAPSTAARRVHVFVSGQVQGVGFRAFTQAEARKHALTGWVKNLADGRVEAVVEGPADKVAELLELLKRGPPAAKVEKLDLTEEKPTGDFKSFEVRRD